MKAKIKNVFFRAWYSYVSSVDKNAEVTFMNYGFSRDNHKIDLHKQDEPNRYSAQLYHHVASGAPIEGKDILEVGCGRGGGLSFVTRYFNPKSSTGLDLNKKAIDFCSSQYRDLGINFKQGNAENLPFEDNSFDIVINVESSHRYEQMNNFLAEVYRVLRPGGHFLFTDFRLDHELDELNQQFQDTKFKELHGEKITQDVVEALKLSSADRVKLIQKMAPRFLHKVSRNFAGIEGSPTYNRFANQEYEYLYHVLKKES
eukprot:Anaeramoba_ignava/a481686_8.p1 GENE.a481686_8~~a481686_8.p1  ORF type:complete len:258 (-),score=25.15 a481686_8:20-793(-)